MEMPTKLYISLCASGMSVSGKNCIPKTELNKKPQMTAKMPPIANTPASDFMPPFCRARFL